MMSDCGKNSFYQTMNQQIPQTLSPQTKEAQHDISFTYNIENDYEPLSLEEGGKSNYLAMLRDIGSILYNVDSYLNKLNELKSEEKRRILPCLHDYVFLSNIVIEKLKKDLEEKNIPHEEKRRILPYLCSSSLIMDFIQNKLKREIESLGGSGDPSKENTAHRPPYPLEHGFSQSIAHPIYPPEYALPFMYSLPQDHMQHRIPIYSDWGNELISDVLLTEIIKRETRVKLTGNEYKDIRKLTKKAVKYLCKKNETFLHLFKGNKPMMYDIVERILRYEHEKRMPMKLKDFTEMKMRLEARACTDPNYFRRRRKKRAIPVGSLVSAIKNTAKVAPLTGL